MMVSIKTVLRLMLLSVLLLALYVSCTSAEKQNEKNTLESRHHIVKRGARTIVVCYPSPPRSSSSSSSSGGGGWRRRRALAEEHTEHDDFVINEETNTIIVTVSDEKRSEIVASDYNRGIFMVTSPEKKTCNLHTIPEHMRNVDLAEEVVALQLMQQAISTTGKPIQAHFDRKYMMKFEVDDKAVNVTDLSDDILDICQTENYKLQWMRPDEVEDKSGEGGGMDDKESRSGSEETDCAEAWVCNWIYMGAWHEQEYCCSATWFECERNCTRKTWLPVYRFKCGMESPCNN